MQSGIHAHGYLLEVGQPARNPGVHDDLLTAENAVLKDLLTAENAVLKEFNSYD
jgi:hypothetical protein